MLSTVPDRFEAEPADSGVSRTANAVRWNCGVSVCGELSCKLLLDLGLPLSRESTMVLFWLVESGKEVGGVLFQTVIDGRHHHRHHIITQLCQSSLVRSVTSPGYPLSLLCLGGSICIACAV